MFIRSGYVLISAVLALGGCTAATETSVETTAGAVQGVRDDTVTRYRGIPYAAPPTGDLRWQPPRPPAAWEGVREVTRSGPACAQGPNRKDASEDCLYLDVTAPRDAQNRPVMVWLHGGGFAEGAGFDYDPARMAAQGDVVVVTVEFRLGMFGFFGAPGLDGGGTFGFQDQQAALRWIRDNVAGFGGDPGNVTLFGESGGAIGTCAQLTSPGARGLFHRAILQSGFCDAELPKDFTPTGSEPFRFFRPAADTDAAGAAAMKALGCTDVACLRKLPAEALHEQYPAFGAASYGTPTLPVDPADAELADVPLMIGANRDEHRLTAGIMALAGWRISAAEYPGLIAGAFGDDAEAIVREYPASDHGGDGALAWAAVFTDSMSCASSGSFTGDGYAYEFADPDAQPYVDLPADFDSGASHGSELPMLFEVAGRKPLSSDRYTDAQRRLAATMVGYWTAFAATGDPNHEGAPAWPSGGAALQLVPDDVRTFDIAAQHRCGFWNGLAAS